MPRAGRRVRMAGDGPAHVPEGVIDEIRSRERRRPDRASKAPALKPGDRVRIIAGAFCGFLALYQGQTDQERVGVLLQFLGGRQRTERSAEGYRELARLPAVDDVGRHRGVRAAWRNTAARVSSPSSSSSISARLTVRRPGRTDHCGLDLASGADRVSDRASAHTIYDRRLTRRRSEITPMFARLSWKRSRKGDERAEPDPRSTRRFCKGSCKT